MTNLPSPCWITYTFTALHSHNVVFCEPRALTYLLARTLFLFTLCSNILYGFIEEEFIKEVLLSGGKRRHVRTSKSARLRVRQYHNNQNTVPVRSTLSPT